MILCLFYLLIGAISYPFIAPMDGIKIQGEPRWAVAIAVAIWSVIWLPTLLYKIGDNKRE